MTLMDLVEELEDAIREFGDMPVVWSDGDRKGVPTVKVYPNQLPGPTAEVTYYDH